MNLSRRSFLLGASAVVTAAAVAPLLPAADPVVADQLLQSSTIGYGVYNDGYAAALARSLNETKEKLAADILNGAFSQNPKWLNDFYSEQIECA